MSHNKHRGSTAWNSRILTSVITLCLAVMTFNALADATDRRQAKRIHDRLAGVPPTPEVLNDMETLIASGGAIDAALKIMTSNPDDTLYYDPIYQNSAKNFYTVTVKNMATPWTNEAQTVFTPLNDYSATVIGMIRDEIPFNQLLSADILYMGSGVPGLPAYSMDNNNHYEYLENQGIDLSDTTNLVRVKQSDHTNIPPSATAGILTSRAAARAFFIDGTNRAMFRFTMMNHLCTDLEPIKDTSRIPDRIPQDVTRSPGGDSRIFMNSCVGCHAGMDPMNQAFAYYNYQYSGDEESGRLVYTPNSVQGKYLINPDNFKYGYITTDDNWSNYWRVGPNSLLGWDTNGLGLPSSGNGAKSMGAELANSYAFASCQVKKIFRTVCFREPTIAGAGSELSAITANFISSNYNMKQVFAEVADACKGD
jgi:hypothetical protein